MKKSNMAISVGLIALCIIGWLSVTIQKVEDNSSYQTYIKEADGWVKEGLYQRAITSYKNAIAEEPTADLYKKAAKAYQLRKKEVASDIEATDEIEGEYVAFLEEATSFFPAEADLVDALADYYLKEEEYQEAYDCLMEAMDQGYDTEKVRKKWLQAKYAYDLKGDCFDKIKTSGGSVYTVSEDGAWSTYVVGEGYRMNTKYKDAGIANEDGDVVVTGKDSRLISGEGVVLGIFQKKVTEAGVFAEGLVPAMCDGTYHYYDEFAEEQFGGYEMASMFQNGKAAVKKDGKWMLIDTKGKVVSDKYAHIVLDASGKYVINEKILAAKKKGNYAIYNEKMKEKQKIDGTEVDVLTEDGWIAFCQKGKWGYMNLDGKVVIKPQYEAAKSFSNGMAAVKNGDNWGFINEDNELVLEGRFTDAGYMNEAGVCAVRMDKPLEETSEEETSEEETSEEETSEDDTEGDSMEIWQFLQLELGIIEGL